MRILLVNPSTKIKPLDQAIKFPPQGLISIGSFLENHTVKIVDLKVEKFSEFIKVLPDFELVAVTAFTPSIKSALDICKIAKKQGKKTAIGGVHVTLDPSIIQNRYVDYVIRGEGELVLKELADGKHLSKIAGLSYKKDGKVLHNKLKSPIKNLDTLPFDKIDLIDLSKYHAFGRKLASINSSRGCPHNCHFCCTPIVCNRRWRAKSPERIIKEIKKIPKSVKIVYFSEDNFCNDMNRVSRLCDLIIKNKLTNFEYGCEVRLDNIFSHPPIVSKMAKANFKLTVVGIESASQKSLNTIQKNETLNQIKKSVSILKKNGFMIWGTFIIGNLYESKKDVLKTVKFSDSLGVDVAQFTVLTPFPGTPLFYEAKKNNLLLGRPWSKYTTVSPTMKTYKLNRRNIYLLLAYAYLYFYNPFFIFKRFISYSLDKKRRWIIRRYLSILPVALKLYFLLWIYSIRHVLSYTLKKK